MTLDAGKVRAVVKAVENNVETKHIRRFSGQEKPLFLISETYFGVWLEHVYDAVLFAEMYPEKGREVAENTIETFISLQKNGQYPCYFWDGAKSGLPAERNVGYFQMQECASFGTMCLKVAEYYKKDDFLRRCYRSLAAWVEWQKKYRMTTGRGLVEMFCGYDTGHDNSGRLDGMLYRDNHRRWGVGKELGAHKKPTFCRVAPVLAVDMNAVLYGNLTALVEMAERLGESKEADKWRRERRVIKEKLFELCYNKEDAFFYDVDKNGKQRKYLSSTVLHLFQEGVLDREEDEKLIGEILRRHVLEPKEFWTEYPFPSMAICDPSARQHKRSNDWGYFTQGNTEIRTTLWMDKYGLSAEQDRVCEQWVSAWTDVFDRMPVGQELDPTSGEPSPSSPWYSSGMLFYLWSVRRLHLL